MVEYNCVFCQSTFHSKIKDKEVIHDISSRAKVCSQMSKVVYKASCWDCQEFYVGKTKRRLHDRKTEHFVKGVTSCKSTCHASAIADHVTSTGHNIKWDHFEIGTKGRSYTHCKIKETLELNPTLNDNVSGNKLYLYQFASFICKFFSQLLSLLLLISC